LRSWARDVCVVRLRDAFSRSEVSTKCFSIQKGDFPRRCVPTPAKRQLRQVRRGDAKPATEMEPIDPSRPSTNPSGRSHRVYESGERFPSSGCAQNYWETTFTAPGGRSASAAVPRRIAPRLLHPSQRIRHQQQKPATPSAGPAKLPPSAPLRFAPLKSVDCICQRSAGSTGERSIPRASGGRFFQYAAFKATHISLFWANLLNCARYYFAQAFFPSICSLKDFPVVDSRLLSARLACVQTTSPGFASSSRFNRTRYGLSAGNRNVNRRRAGQRRSVVVNPAFPVGTRSPRLRRRADGRSNRHRCSSRPEHESRAAQMATAIALEPPMPCAGRAFRIGWRVKPPSGGELHDRG